MLNRPLIIVIVVIACGCFALWIFRPNAGADSVYRTMPIQHGDMVIHISSTGTIEPDEVIDVGAQVAGQILELGKDQRGKTINYGTVIEEGMVLAKIDESLYAAQVSKDEKDVISAEADLLRAKADHDLFKEKHLQAKRDWERAKKLISAKALSRSKFEEFESELSIASLKISISEAAMLQSKSLLGKAKASLHRAELNLGYCTIKSPVDGIVIDRRIDVGQTVVSNLNAPSLFLLAKDLKSMQIWVTVNEADILKIKKGQHVNFSVDALPGEQFTGVVDKIRLNASMTQNVVSYIVEVNIDNSRGRLLPYLTANVEFQIDRRTNILMISNSAFNWRPHLDQISPEYRQSFELNEKDKDVIWVRDERYVRPLKVQSGLTDGLMTEVAGKSIKEGLSIVVGAQNFHSKKRPENPFMVKLPKPPGNQSP